MTCSAPPPTKANSLILFLADVDLDVHETSNYSLFLAICSPKRTESNSAVHKMKLDYIIDILRYINFTINYFNIDILYIYYFLNHITFLLYNIYFSINT